MELTIFSNGRIPGYEPRMAEAKFGLDDKARIERPFSPNKLGLFPVGQENNVLPFFA